MPFACLLHRYPTRCQWIVQGEETDGTNKCGGWFCLSRFRFVLFFDLSSSTLMTCSRLTSASFTFLLSSLSCLGFSTLSNCTVNVPWATFFSLFFLLCFFVSQCLTFHLCPLILHILNFCASYCLFSPIQETRTQTRRWKNSNQLFFLSFRQSNHPISSFSLDP